IVVDAPRSRSDDAVTRAHRPALPQLEHRLGDLAVGGELTRWRDALSKQRLVVRLDRIERLERAVGDRAHELDHVERRLGEIDLAAKQRDARAILLRLKDQLEAIAGGAGAAAEHADDQARVEGSELVEGARP